MLYLPIKGESDSKDDTEMVRVAIPTTDPKHTSHRLKGFLLRFREWGHLPRYLQSVIQAAQCCRSGHLCRAEKMGLSHWDMGMTAPPLGLEGKAAGQGRLVLS